MEAQNKTHYKLEELKRIMFRHFRRNRGGSLIKQWLTVRQESTAEEHEKKLIQFASNVDEEMRKEILLQISFELDRRIQTELRVLEPVI